MEKNDGKVAIGTPKLESARVTIKIIQHLKGDKEIIFKKKRRKGYQVKNGHRQYLSEVEIQKIEEKAKGKSTKVAKEAVTDSKETTKAPKSEKKVSNDTKAATKPKAEKETPTAKKESAKDKAPIENKNSED